MIVAWYAKRKSREVVYPPAPTKILIDDDSDMFIVGRYIPGEGTPPPAPTKLEINDNTDMFIINPNLPAI